MPQDLLTSWLKELPAALQYMIIIALILIILYVCLTLTRLFGKNKGEQITYDNPEEYEKQVPDLFASTAFKRRPKQQDDDKAN